MGSEFVLGVALGALIGFCAIGVGVGTLLWLVVRFLFKKKGFAYPVSLGIGMVVSLVWMLIA